MRLVGGENQGTKMMMTFLFIMAFPKLGKKFKLSAIDEEATFFLVDVIKQSLKSRKESSEKKNDFIDLILAALKDEVQFEFEDDQFEKDAQIEKQKKKTLSQDELEIILIASLFILFIAGFDTSSTILTYASYYLAKHPNYQNQLLEEINDKITDEEMENLDYAKAQSLTFLDQIIHETLRKHPLLFIERTCTKPYTIPGTDFTVPVGIIVSISNAGIMHDQKYCSNPDEFYPDHFSPENKAKRNPYAFLGFGQGPRGCIGMRFALISLKMGLIRLVKNFEIVKTPRTPEKLEIDPMSPTGQSKDKIYLGVKKR